jgi:SAM-dependent methyltransferase
MSEVDQQTIIAWFDSIYRREGASYLRPVEAYFVFLELLRARTEHTLLDVACGAGMLLQAASGCMRHLHGTDISEVAVALAKRNVPGASIALANAERLPYRNETFDLVTCLGSLERMLNASKALEEIRRVGKRNARYCFLVRNSSTFSWKVLGRIQQRQLAASHAGADSLSNWTSRFERSGFRILDVLPDQYPLHLRKRWASLSLKPVDFRKPLTTTSRLDRANEFIFILEQRQ